MKSKVAQRMPIDLKKVIGLGKEGPKGVKKKKRRVLRYFRSQGVYFIGNRVRIPKKCVPWSQLKRPRSYAHLKIDFSGLRQIFEIFGGAFFGLLRVPRGLSCSTFCAESKKRSPMVVAQTVRPQRPIQIRGRRTSNSNNFFQRPNSRLYHKIKVVRLEKYLLILSKKSKIRPYLTLLFLKRALGTYKYVPGV